MAAGYVVEGLSDLEQRLLRRRGIPERYVVMTFDDGHRSNLRAAEILCRAGAQATFFLIRDFCRQRPDFLGYTLAGNSVDWWNEPTTVASRRLVNRVAIRQGMPLSVFKRVVEQDATFLLQRRLRAGALELARRVIPLHQYEQLSRALHRPQTALPHRLPDP